MLLGRFDNSRGLDALLPIKDIADQLTDQLDLNDASAVLLVRRLAPGARLCRHSIDWVLQLADTAEIVYVPRPTDNQDRPHVNPIASPN